jgi:hypothetical protein
VDGDGREFPVEIGLSPVATPAGKYVIAAVIDITQRKKRERESTLARLVQEAMLPRIPDDLSGLAVAARSDPADATGGDFYDLLRFDDGRTGQASYEVDLPNGGKVLMEGNTLVQSPLTENPVMLAYGAEGQAWPDSQLTLRRNTFVNRRPQGGSFVRVWADRLPPAAPVRTEHNQWLGTGDLLLGPAGQSMGDRRGALPD